MRTRYKISELQIVLLSFLLFGNIFLFPYSIRTVLFGVTGAYINIFWFIGFLLLIFFMKKKLIWKFSFGNSLSTIVLIFLLFSSYVILGKFVSRLDMVRTFLVMCAPILLTLVHFKDSKDFKLFFRASINFMAIPIYLTILFGILDVFQGRIYSLFFLNLYQSFDSLPKHFYMNRMISYFGHPLYASQLLLIFGVLHGLWSKYYNNGKIPYIPYATTIIGLALTSSKAATICFLVYILLTNLKFSGLKFLISFSCIAYILYQLGLFETVVNRFLEGFASGDVTSNRNSSLIDMINSGYLKFNFWQGEAPAVPNDPIFIAALEYPPLQIAYYHGFLYVIFLYTFLLIHPITYFFRNIKYPFYISISYLTLLIYINTNNGLSNGRDGMILLTTIIMIFININNENHDLEVIK